ELVSGRGRWIANLAAGASAGNVDLRSLGKIGIGRGGKPENNRGRRSRRTRTQNRSARVQGIGLQVELRHHIACAIDRYLHVVRVGICEAFYARMEVGTVLGRAADRIAESLPLIGRLRDGRGRDFDGIRHGVELPVQGAPQVLIEVSALLGIV